MATPRSAPWILTAALATVVVYAFGAIVSLDEDSPGWASWSSVAMLVLVVVACLVAVVRQGSPAPRVLAQLALVVGVVGVVVSALSR